MRYAVVGAICAMVMATLAGADPRVSAFDKVFDQAAAADDNLALGAAVAFGNGAPEVRVAGPTNKGSQTPVVAEAPWQIGSITKSMTASMILRLSQRAILDLDAPIGPILAPIAPDLHPTWHATTLRQLLSHSAGMRANPGRFEMWGDDATARSILQGYWADPLPGAVGKFQYSNLGYVLAGLVAETATGRPWASLIEDEVVGPLDLRSFGLGAPEGAGVPWGHLRRLGFTIARDPQGNAVTDNPAWMQAAGRAHLSLADLVAYGQAHQAACAGGSTFLSQDSCQQMRRVEAGEYGLGWIVQADGQRIWHNGSNTLWYAVLLMIPEEDVVIAITANRADGPRIDQLLRDMVSAVLTAGAP